MNAAPTRQQLLDWISAWMTQELRVAVGDVAPDRTFVSYGMDSIHAMMLVGDLEEQLGRRFPPTLAWDHPTPAALASHLVPDSAAPGIEAPAVSSSAALSPAEPSPAASSAALLAQIDTLSEDAIDRLLEAQRRTTSVP